MPIPTSPLRFMNPVARLNEARKLPTGHYEIAEAQAALDREYAEARAVEKQLKRRYKTLAYMGKLSLQEAAQITFEVCEAIGTRPPKMIYRKDSRVQPGAEAHYVNREISFCSDFICTTTLFHELAHHVVYIEGLTGRHSHDFLWAMTLLWEAADSLRIAERFR